VLIVFVHSLGRRFRLAPLHPPYRPLLVGGGGWREGGGWVWVLPGAPCPRSQPSPPAPPRGRSGCGAWPRGRGVFPPLFQKTPHKDWRPFVTRCVFWNPTGAPTRHPHCGMFRFMRYPQELEAVLKGGLKRQYILPSNRVCDIL